ncbi:MAG: hypothetical protein ACI4TF_04450 [Oliverpabstia sp.]
MLNRKHAVWGSALAVVAAVILLAVPAFAASDPADNANNYRYNTGRIENADRQSIYSELPENATDEDLEAFYENHEVGESSAYSDGEYDETAKENYSYMKGYHSYQEWHSTFEDN